MLINQHSFSLFSTYVEVTLIQQHSCSYSITFLHIRGGNPVIIFSSMSFSIFSPHTWRFKKTDQLILTCLFCRSAIFSELKSVNSVPSFLLLYFFIGVANMQQHYLFIFLPLSFSPPLLRTNQQQSYFIHSHFSEINISIKQFHLINFQH